MNPVIGLNNLSFGYSDRRVLQDLSLTINTGEWIAFIGTSGCGKSTLLKLLHGLLIPDSGTVNVSGKSALLFQDDRLLPWYSCTKNICLSSNDKLLQNQAQQLLERMGISEVANLLPGKLSGGMRQRVALARALVTQPDILLLDEPFAAIDQITRQLLITEIRKLRKDWLNTLVLVTHDIEEALFLADKVIILKSTPATISHCLSIPELPENWKDFFLSDIASDLKAQIHDKLQEFFE